MRVTDIIGADRPSLSFEVFPPKTTDAFESVMSAAAGIAALGPSYMSVTYGAGGSTAGFTAEVAELSFPLLQHITARITSEVQGVNRVLWDITPKPTDTIEWE